MIHNLKIAPVHFRDVISGIKTAEFRLNDRDFHVDDILDLKEYENGLYTGNSIIRRVVHVCDVGFAAPGYVMLSIETCTYMWLNAHEVPTAFGVKFKAPPKGSKELDEFYDLVFGSRTFDASWAGRVGHYLYGDDHQIADNQDGYVYLWPRLWNAHIQSGRGVRWIMSADYSIASSMSCKYVEINI